MIGIAKPPFGAELDKDHALAQGMVACFVMNEGSGRRLRDLSQRSAFALSGGGTADPSWVGGSSGRALRFDGSNDYFTVGTPVQLNLAGPMTIVARVCRTGTASACQVISKGFESNITQYQLYFQDNDGFSRANRMRFGTYNGSHQEVVSNSQVALGTWQQWIAGYTGSSYRMVLNGTLDSISPNPVAPVSNGRNVFIGAVDAPSAGGTLQFWPGLIDYIYVYARSLEEEEEERIYQEPFSMIRSGIARKFYSISSHVSAAVYFRLQQHLGLGA
jgi:hypothetical protein